MPFSQELNELQEEVKPLWKMPSCPRDFKRTSVEILFREAEFRLDWCSFRLVSCVRLNCVATCESFAAINVIYPRGVFFIRPRYENCLLTLLFIMITHVICLSQNYAIACDLYYHVNIITSIQVFNIIVISWAMQISRHVIVYLFHSTVIAYFLDNSVVKIILNLWNAVNSAISSINFTHDFDLRNFTQNDDHANHAPSLCNISLYDALLVSWRRGKDIISAARGRSAESAARERSEGTQCERRGSTIVGHLRTHGVAVGPFDES